MLTAVCVVMLVIIVALLLTGKVSLPPIFIIIPVVACLIIGCDLGQINKFISTGLSSVLNTVALFTFAVLYFSILNDVGMFDVIVNKFMKYLGNKVWLVMLITCLVATISHLDGSGATTMLVTIPLMLPIYKKMKISPLALILLANLCSGSMNMTPWCSSVMRLCAATGGDGYELWKYVVPLQGVALVLSYLVIFPLAKMEEKRGAGMTDAEFAELKLSLDKPAETKVSRKVIIFDMILTLVLLVVMLLGYVKSNLGFMLALAIALIVNFPDPKMQTKKVKEFGGTALNMIMIIFSIGVLVGVLKDSGMMDALVQALLGIIPESAGKHIPWVISVLSVPLSMFLGSDTVYMAVAPIVNGVVGTYGVSALVSNASFLIGACLSAGICLVGPSPYLALGLAGCEMKDSLKYCFLWIFGINFIISILAAITGIIPM